MTVFHRGIEALATALKTIPHLPGIYRMVNARGDILYIGKARNLYKRVKSYTHTDPLPHRLKRMVSEVAHVDIVITKTEVEALLLEANLIKTHQPPYNILLKEGHTMSYIVLTDHPFPLLTRKRHPKNVRYRFGPFPSSEQINLTLDCLYKAFLLRSCSDHTLAHRHRPCLQYYIKRCSAPCVRRIEEAAYSELVNQAVAFLRGKSSEIQPMLAEKMVGYSKAENYEQAAIMRDRIKALSQIQAHQTIHNAQLEEADIIALVHQEDISCIVLFCFRHGTNYGTQSFFFPHTEKTEAKAVMEAFIQQFYQTVEPPRLLLLNGYLFDPKAFQQVFKTQFSKNIQIMIPKRGPNKAVVDHATLNAQKELERYYLHYTTQRQNWEKLATLFHMPTPPQRVEVYDNSHLRGTNPVSAMVVAGPEGFQKSAYRTFMPKERCEDDYAMMRRVMQQRFKKTDILPDLILLDGGKGQLSVVMQTLAEIGITGITIVAVSKGPQRKQDLFHQPGYAPFELPAHSAVLHLLQRLRDEAHRFALYAHQRKRSRVSVTSRFQDIPGVGEKRRRALFHHFGTLETIQEATPVDLQRVSGISAKLAQKIYDFFQKTR